MIEANLHGGPKDGTVMALNTELPLIIFDTWNNNSSFKSKDSLELGQAIYVMKTQDVYETSSRDYYFIPPFDEM